MGHVNLKIVLAYDGTHFHGWQTQKNDRTVQQELERALGEIHGGPPITVWGAGRTDAGVHARGQVAHVKLGTRLSPEKMMAGLNSLLPEDVRIRAVEIVPDDFHARFDATSRRYSYTMTNGMALMRRHYIWEQTHDLNNSTLETCAGQLIGHHDFAGFVKANSEVESTVCNVEFAHWEILKGDWTFHIKADRFLHHMVRYLVGTMVDVARGRFTAGDFQGRLDGNLESLKLFKAPAKGLVLEEVTYD